ncbi:major facilitator superfamily domain-containing protein [Coprinopsis sp. MPI-PUGE-AT-0042]|nr:major facilitator superfamily domain-containing protein [Coprinopsis sp. MPI-PUGE-AT-0042]
MLSHSHKSQSSSPIAVPLESEETSRQLLHAPARRWTFDELSDGQSSGAPTPSFEHNANHLTSLSPVRTPDHSKVVIPRHTGKCPNTYGDVIATPVTPSIRSLAGEQPCTEVGTPSTSREKVAARLVAGYFAYFCCGWTDGALATVLPFLMRDFNLNFTASSLLYVASTIGYELFPSFLEEFEPIFVSFVGGSFVLEFILQRLGRIHPSRTKFSWLPHHPFSRKRPADSNSCRHSAAQALHLALVYATFLFSLYFCLMGTKTGFPALFMAYVTLAFSRAIVCGCLNPFFTSVAPMHVSYAHALWSFGTVVSPLVCQAVLSKGIPWPYFYFGSLIFAFVKFLLATIAFAPTPSELEDERRKSSCSSPPSSATSTPTDVKEQYFPVPRPAPPTSALRMVLSHPFQWFACLFIAIYFGTETTSQAFIVTYLLGHRHADPKTAGYVPAGFFAGVMTGRIIWGIYSQKSSYERRRIVVFGCLLVAVTMQILIVFLNSIIANVLSVVFVGLTFGPIFPAVMNMVGDTYLSEQKLPGMAILAAGSSLGSAVLPLVLGVLMSSKGVHVLPYWNTALTAATLAIWACLPSHIPSTGSKWLSQKQ